MIQGATHVVDDSILATSELLQAAVNLVEGLHRGGVQQVHLLASRGLYSSALIGLPPARAAGVVGVSTSEL